MNKSLVDITILGAMFGDSPYNIFHKIDKEKEIEEIKEYQELLLNTKLLIKDKSRHDNSEIKEALYDILISSNTRDICYSDSTLVLAKKFKKKLETLIALKAMLIRG